AVQGDQKGRDFQERLCRTTSIRVAFSLARLINVFLIALISRKLISRGQKTPRESDATADFRLTLRESEILPFLLEGASNEEIGGKLHISPHTVKNHITDIFRKTGAESRFDLLKTYKRMN
ncbi:MAG TPA: helix-turn-helix transcriptional regulator, partial [Spirochaetia bacterium]|nr:helix-turn-helix transcriptional regulator [Spirochaetia bacterium]